ncbi:MAG: XdhC family protein [Aquabacterium sp.]|nr:MAG: XdhC family protein [Aquabacterium sp.]
MDSADLLVLRTLRDWRRAGRRARLVTVLRTWGSSPRPPGSILALADDGELVGSVSGGCIEDDLVHRYAGQDEGAGPPQRLTYGLSADEAHRFGLPCGGTMELLVERDPSAGELDALVHRLSAGCLVRRRVRLSDGQATLEEADQPQDLQVADGQVAQTFGPGWRMLLIGAGQLAEYLATMAAFSGFAVTVCDPREPHRAAWRADGTTLVHDMPDDAVNAFRPDRRSAVIALTHDPKLDDLALMDALQTQAFYVGAIGSRRNSEARRLRLAEHFGLSADELRRLRGPIGLYIGSKTPAEIAVSVMAEVLAVKNGVALPRQMQVEAAKELLGA